MLIVVSSLALAVDLPTASSGAISAANTAYPGSAPIHPGAPSRLKPSALRARLALLEQALASACAPEASGFTGGAYGQGVAQGTTDASGAVLVTYDTGAFRIEGTYEGVDAGTVVGTYRNGRFVLDIADDRVTAGEFVRVAGSRGVFVGLTASCEPGGSARSALEPWFGAPLPGLDATPAVDGDNDTFFDDVDCDDGDPEVYPGAIERCNGLDDDCDELTDDEDPDVVDPDTFFPDLDDDGFGGAPFEACVAEVPVAAVGGDCDDSDPSAWPGAPELCDGKRNDCDDPAWTFGSEPALTRADASGSSNLADFPGVFGGLATWSVCQDGLTLTGGAFATMTSRNTIVGLGAERPAISYTGVGSVPFANLVLDHLELRGPGSFQVGSVVDLDDCDIDLDPTVAFVATGGTIQTSGGVIRDSFDASGGGAALILAGTVSVGDLDVRDGAVLAMRGSAGSHTGAIVLDDANDGDVISSLDGVQVTCGATSTILLSGSGAIYTFQDVRFADCQVLAVEGADARITRGSVTQSADLAPFASLTGGFMEASQTTVIEGVSLSALAVTQSSGGTDLVLDGVQVAGNAYDLIVHPGPFVVPLTAVGGAVTASCTNGACTGPSAP